MPAPEHPSKPFSSVGHSLHVHLPYCEYILAEPARSFAGSLSLAPPSSRWNVHGVFTSFFSRAAATTRAQLESVALAECSLLRTQLPATFRARSSIALTGEFLRWRDHVDVSAAAR